MTNREKAFVLNGLRAYLSDFYDRMGFDHREVDEKLSKFAAEEKVPLQLLEETRLEQQWLVHLVRKKTGVR